LDIVKDYQRALAERDATGAEDARPIYARLRGEAGAAPAKVRPKRQRAAAEPPPRKRRSRPPRIQQARALLREQLTGGPKPGALVEAAAKAAEIPKRELLAAADALGVRCRRGRWWLPARIAN
jgi:hypothetical protein